MSSDRLIFKAKQVFIALDDRHLAILEEKKKTILKEHRERERICNDELNKIAAKRQEIFARRRRMNVSVARRTTPMENAEINDYV